MVTEAAGARGADGAPLGVQGSGADAGLPGAGSGTGTTVVPVAGGGNLSIPSEPNYGPRECLADLERAMAAAGDANHMTAAEKAETALAVLSAARRHYPELSLERVARIMVANMRQESDYQPRNVSGEREGSGDAVGLLQVSPYGSSQELQLFVRHYDANGLVDYRTNRPYDMNALVPEDLKGPWLNVHVATWVQSNLARSGCADPSDWGRKIGPRPATYQTGLGGWVAGPAISASGYGMSGDDISAAYFRGILQSLDQITGSHNTNEAFSSLAVSPNVLHFLP
jgi:hypothetical protein